MFCVYLLWCMFSINSGGYSVLFLGMIRQDSNYSTSGQTSLTSSVSNKLFAKAHAHV